MGRTKTYTILLLGVVDRAARRCAVRRCTCRSVGVVVGSVRAFVRWKQVLFGRYHRSHGALSIGRSVVDSVSLVGQCDIGR